jgi:natural product precursor
VKKVKKLQLKKVTLRDLDEPTMQGMAGGGNTVAHTCPNTCPVTCHSTCATCPDCGITLHTPCTQ